MRSSQNLIFRFYALFFRSICRIRCSPAAVRRIRRSSFFASPCCTRRCLPRRRFAFRFFIGRVRMKKGFEHCWRRSSVFSLYRVRSRRHGLSGFRFSHGCRFLSCTYFFQLAERCAFCAAIFRKKPFRFFCRKNHPSQL